MGESNDPPMPIDPTTFEVIRHRTWQITDEMGITLKHVSVSPVVTDVNDFSTGLFLADGSAVNMGSYMIAHYGPAPIIVKNVLLDCSSDPGIEEGDMFISNDPWKGSQHTADVAVVSPLHWKGQLVGFTHAMAHQLDIGMIVPGGFAVTEDIYQEGVRIPPTKIVSRGNIRNDILNMIMNMIRVPQVLLDFKGLIASNNVARTRVKELFEKYGEGAVVGVWEEIIRRSRAAFKARLSDLPDGTFSHIDRMESDGIRKGNFEVRVKMTKKGGELIFDFTGTSSQVRSSINCTFGATLAGICGAVQPALAPDIDWNEGIIGSVKVIAPKGSLVNAVLPAAVCRSSVTSSWLVKNCAQACVGRLLATSPKYARDAQAVWMGNQTIVQISGLNQYGERFAHVFLDTMAGGVGATASGDGMDCAGDAFVMTLVIADIEAHEAKNPILFLYRRRKADTGGAGKFRGGLAIEQAITPYDVDSVQATALAHGFEMPNAAGLFGGYPGCQSEFRLIRKTNLTNLVSNERFPHSVDEVKGQEEEVGSSVPLTFLDRWDVFHYHWSGGGGYGDPLDRDPKLVFSDYRSGVISLEAARSQYGVVIFRDGVEQKATAELRQEIRRLRVAL